MSHELGSSSQAGVIEGSVHRNELLKGEIPNFCWISIQSETQLRIAEYRRYLL
jgi:hypothetical protein